MKKTVFFLLLMGILPLSLFAANVVSGVEGQPVLVRDGYEQPVTKGMEVLGGDIIKTGSGQADVSLNGGAGIRLLSDSEAQLKSIEQENTQIDLKVGNIIANLKKKIPEGSKFEVETPAAVLAVRGTQFWGQTQPGTSPKTTFAVRQGVVSVRDKATSEEFSVNKGQAIELAGQGQPALTREATVNELDAISQAELILIEE